MSLELRFSTYGKKVNLTFVYPRMMKELKGPQGTRDEVYMRHSRVGIWIVAFAPHP